MVQIKAFSYNPNAKYQPSGVSKTKDPDMINQTREVKQASDSPSGFKVKFPQIFAKYVLPYVEIDAIIQNWHERQMQFLAKPDKFCFVVRNCRMRCFYARPPDRHNSAARSLFLFHVYYQTRRILFEMKVALPTDDSWNAFDNSYDKRAYERICDEFGVSVHTNWRQEKDLNQGLDTMYNYWTMDGYHPLSGAEYDKKRYSFTQTTTNTLLHIDYIAQSFPKAWTTFILDKSDGFTNPGVERINESIRTYCWAILGSQSQIKSDILGVGSAFDAQKQFLANTEDAIQSPVDLPSQITRYQNALKYARTKVDYLFGFGLYMAPSNMELRIGTIQGYNNKIILSTHDQKLWWNATVNLSADATSYSGNVSGTTTKKSTPEVPTVLSKPQKPNIPTVVQGKTEIGAWGMPITIPTQKQAAEIYTYGPTIAPDPHQMSLIPKTASDPQLLKQEDHSGPVSLP